MLAFRVTAYLNGRHSIADVVMTIVAPEKQGARETFVRYMSVMGFIRNEYGPVYVIPFQLKLKGGNNDNR